MEIQWEAAVSALAGSGIAGAMAKLYIQNLLKDVSTAVDHISKIQIQLAAIAVKLEHSEKHERLLIEHDRKITALEAFTHGSPVSIHRKNI